MIKNESVESWVSQDERRVWPTFQLLKAVAEKLVRSLIERDNRPIHVDWRWHSAWLYSRDGGHTYKISVSVIWGYVDPHHCLNSGDLLYYTQASPRLNVLRTIDPIKPMVTICHPGAIPPIAPPGKTKTFHRQRFFIRWPSVKCPLNQKAEIFNDYWELA